MLLLLSFVLLLTGYCHACTEFILRAKDDSITMGRSLDFDIIIDVGFYVEPKHMQHEAHVPKTCTSNPMTWKSRHRLIVVRPLQKELNYVSLDGVNDAGLTVSTLYLPGYAMYQNVSADECGHTIPQTQVAGYMLAMYSTVKEAREAIGSNNFPLVWGVQEFGMIQPLHFGITDASGDSIVLEYTAEGRRVHNNNLGVMTNSPTYDWHTTNAEHYVHLSNKRKPQRKYNDAKGGEHVIPPLPASGLLGLPGDMTSPSRFIRAAAMVHLSKVPDTFEEAVVTSFHILSSVDVITGTVQGRRKVLTRTFWQLVKDLKNRCMYYRTYEYLSIRKLCLSDVHATHAFFPFNDEFKHSVEDVSGKVHPINIADEL